MKKIKKKLEFLKWSELYDAKIKSYLDLTLEENYKEEYRKKFFEERSNEKDLSILFKIEKMNEKIENFENEYNINDLINEEKYEKIKNYVEYYWIINRYIKNIEESLEKNLKKSSNDLKSFLKHIYKKNIKSIEGTQKYKNYFFDECVWYDSIIEKQKEISIYKNILELNFLEVLEKNIKIKIFNKVYINKEIRDTKMNEMLRYERNIGFYSLILANFSNFSNFINIQKYKGLINKNKDVELDDIKNIILEKNKFKNDFYTINTKLLFLSDEDIMSSFWGLINLNEKNYLDLDHYDKNNIFKMILTLKISNYKNIVIVDLTSENSEYFVYPESEGEIYKAKEIELKEKLELLKNNNNTFIVKKTKLNNLVKETREYLFSEDLENIENSKNEKLQRKLYIEELYKKSLFVFVNRNTSWKNVVSEFRRNKIYISGGMNNQKIMLGLLEFKFVNLLKNFVEYDLISTERFLYNLIKDSTNTYIKYKEKIDKNEKFDVVPFQKPFKVEKFLVSIPSMFDSKNKIDLLNQELYESWIKKIADIDKNDDVKLDELINLNKLNKSNIIREKREYHTLINKHKRRFYSTSTSTSSYKIKRNFDDKNNTNDLKNPPGEYDMLNINNNSFLNIFLYNLSKFIDDNNITWEEKQFKLEENWLSFYDNYKNNDNIFTKNYDFYTDDLLIKALKTLQLKMESGTIKKKFSKNKNKNKKKDQNLNINFKNDYYPYLNNIHVLNITKFTGLNLFAKKNTIGWTEASGIIGEKILDYIWFKIISDENFFECDIVKNSGKNVNIDEYNALGGHKEKLYFKMKFFNYEDFLAYFSIDNQNLENVIIGDFFLELFSNEPHVIFTKIFGVIEDEDNLYKDYSKINRILKVDDNIFEKTKINLIPDNLSIPMLCKPLPWSEESKGGHLLLSKKKDYDIITGNKNHGHYMLNKDKLYKVVNILNSLEFTINSDLLNYLETEDGMKFIEKEMQNPQKLHFIYNLNYAKIFKNKIIYLPISGDWRGRLYVSPFFLNYQGSDFSRAIIYMANGKKLDDFGYRYLCIYGATLYNQNNMSKETFEKKIEWTEANLDKICKLDYVFIENADNDNRWLFLSFCLVMKKYKEDNNCIVRFPIFMDATCNGFQHVGAMIKDIKIAKSVNLFVDKNDEDKVQDVYSILLNYINDDIRELSLTDENYKNFRYIKLKRKNVKQSIMTKTYNVTLKGMVEQIINSATKVGKLNEDKNNNLDSKFYIVLPYEGTTNEIRLVQKDIFKIAEIIEKNIFKELPALHKIYNYFLEIVKFMNKLNLPVMWSLPNGVVISQHYYKNNQKKLNLNYAGKTKSLILREFTNKLDKISQVNAIIPNIIHSLDANHLMEVILKGMSNNINYILTIHDCFGTHPNDVHKLIELLKIEFVKLYANEDFLCKFHNNILRYIKDNQAKITRKDGIDYVLMKGWRLERPLPKKPKLGDLNLNEILDAKYMFI